MSAKSLRYHDDVIYKPVMSHAVDDVTNQISRPHRALVLGVSCLQLALGTSLTAIGASINHFSQSKVQVASPPIWWTGIVPLQLGCFGLFVFWSNRNRKILYWGCVSLVLPLVQALVMGLCHNYQAEYYSVWPYRNSHNGHPVCRIMVESCYCQDYIGRAETPGVQYIHQDIRWMDSGFADCDDVIHISLMYYTLMTLYGIHLVTSIFSVTPSLLLWRRQTRVHFERLQEEEQHVQHCFEHESVQYTARPHESHHTPSGECTCVLPVEPRTTVKQETSSQHEVDT